MRRTRLSLAALVVASAAALGLPTAASAAPAADSTGVASTSAAAPSGDASAPTEAAPTEGAVPTEGATPAELAPDAAGAAVAATAPADIPVQLIAMNDFHGRISETTGGDSILTTGQGTGPDGVPGTADDGTVVVGGAAHVAATVDALKASFAAANGSGAASYFVGAGDLVGASPFNSSVFKDEPTIEVLDAMGLDASSVGNHEFDRGTEELRRISAATDGLYSDNVSACQGVEIGVTGCFGGSGHEFHGAEFPYLAANVVMKDTGAPMLPPFQVFDVGGGRKIALIGVVTDTTPTIVSPAGIADVQFIDEATAVNQWVPTIQAMGIQSIGVLVHEGGQAGAAAPPAAPYDGCSGLTGPILDINAKTSAAVDFIVSAHSHQAYNCRLTDPSGRPRLVTQAGFYGRLVTDIRLSIDPLTGDVDRAAGAYSATNVPVTRTATDPTVAAIVKYWTDRSADAGNVVVGRATADILRSGAPPAAATRDAESSLGNLVAQSQLEALQEDQYGRPVIAFMNPGGLRTDIAAGDVTYSELFNVQPFGNTVNAITLTGADVRRILEEQFQKDQARGTQLVLGTSAGFSYRYDLSRPYGDRVDPCSIMLNGQVLDPAGTYRVAANSFLVAGGDSFTGFAHGTAPVTGPVDVDTAVAYFKAHSPVAPPAADHSRATTERLGCGGDGGGATPPMPPPTIPAPPVAQPIVGGGAGTGTGPHRSSAAGGSLAYTGVPVAQSLGLGGALVAGGVALTAAGYRRRRDLAD
ncbi:MAG: putative 5-nucleotidase [Modestobacter sp.]|nr:putative 5-nucleotidase [Modestobacter sp.]